MKTTARIAMGVLGVAGAPMIAGGAVAGGPSGGAYSIPWSTIDSGGVLNASGGAYTLSGTIGQPDAGPTQSGGVYSIDGGFWAGVSGAACIPDFTGDGELDFFDISSFLTLLGMEDPQADLTMDGNWDFFDISLFLNLFSMGCP